MENITENTNLQNLTPEQQKLVENSLKSSPRDESKYPTPDPDLTARASLLMYKLNLMGSSLDKNLNALILTLWTNIYEEIRTQDPEHKILQTLSKMKDYIDNSDNILLKTDSLPDTPDTPAQ